MRSPRKRVNFSASKSKCFHKNRCVLFSLRIRENASLCEMMGYTFYNEAGYRGSEILPRHLPRPAGRRPVTARRPGGRGRWHRVARRMVGDAPTRGGSFQVRRAAPRRAAPWVRCRDEVVGARAFLRFVFQMLPVYAHPFYFCT